MKLTDIALRWAKRFPKGHIFRGKYRLVKTVTPFHMAKKREDYETEEKNMFYLRNPYFTLEQEFCHAKIFNHREKFFEKHKEAKVRNWEEHRLLGDRFGFLKISDKWE